MESADFHGAAIGVAHDASAFAEDFGGTNAGAARAEDVGVENGAGGAGGIAAGDFPDEGRNVNAGGAGFDAGSVETKKAAPGFDGGILGREGGLEVGKVGGKGVRAQPGADRLRWLLI